MCPVSPGHFPFVYVTVLLNYCVISLTFVSWRPAETMDLELLNQQYLSTKQCYQSNSDIRSDNSDCFELQ